MKLFVLNIFLTLSIVAVAQWPPVMIDYKPVNILRFDIILSNIYHGASSNMDEIGSDYQAVIDGFVSPLLSDSTSSVSAKLETFANLKNIKYFYNDILSSYPNLDNERQSIDTIQANLQAIFGINLPHLFTLISPYNQPIIQLNDAAIGVALNHYLGAEYGPYRYYPAHIRAFKVPLKIAYDVAEATLRLHFPYQPKDSTLIERILYEGTIAYAIKTVHPSATAQLLFSATNQQIGWALENKNLIFNSIKDILNSKDSQVIEAFFRPKPFFPKVSSDCMGGIGRWIGFQIVSDIISKNTTTIYDLINRQSYQDIIQTLTNIDDYES